MLKMFTQHGNSWALVIDRPILDLINLNPKSTPVQISTDGKKLIISPVRDAARRRKFEAAIDKANKKYRRMFKRLAS
jgi:antitoxin component of MazEF toxin-antitoxin module